MGTIAEANGRSARYLGTPSSAVIAIAYVGQASELGSAFYLFALPSSDDFGSSVERAVTLHPLCTRSGAARL
jgi:hypothetical protein